jgi:hypothetical protein
MARGDARSGDAELARRVELAVEELGQYSRLVVRRPLRPYQLEAGRAIAGAIERREGGTFSVMMARQAGKNELSAQLEGWLLTLRSELGGSLVKCAPTFRPQVVTSMVRLREVLRNPLAEVLALEGQHGYMLTLGRARIVFLSAEPSARVVGATASVLLEVDEAQDVDPEKHDRDFAPMAASANAPRVYYGTAWRQDDLLQSVKEANLARERKDGVRRHFEYPWWVVAEQNPAYGRFVEEERARLGANHPTFLTQYELRPVSPRGALFDEDQLRRLRGEHARLRAPRPGCMYVAGVDVGGSAEMSESAEESAVDRDSTVVTIAEVEPGWARGWRRGDAGTERPGDAGTRGRGEGTWGRGEGTWGRGEGTQAGLLDEDEDEAESRYEAVVRVVEQVRWTGRSHGAQHRELLRLLDGVWRCRAIAFDATGLGEAPCELLRARLGRRVVPVVFTAGRKSALGFGLLAAVNAGRLTVYQAEAGDEEARELWGQARAARRTMRAGGRMEWSVPRGHDDFVVSLALAVHAAGCLRPEAARAITVARDPLAEDGWAGWGLELEARRDW